METFTTPEPTTTPSAPSAGRGTFLTVICILTFIGSSLGLLGGIFGYATADANAAMTSEVMNNMQTQVDNKDTPSFIKQLFGSMADKMNPGTIKKSALLKIISTLLTLFGAIMMFKQRKQGFYMYVAGIIIFVGAPIMVINGFIGVAGAMFAGLIGVAFIIMYAVNLKYMTK